MSSSAKTLNLDVIVIGAGLAGLSAALSLARRGHNVTVLELRPSLSELGAGIQIPANASRILISWGLKEKFDECSDTGLDILVKKHNDGEVLLHVTSDEKAWGYPTWLTYRPHFQKILYDAAIAAGVKVHFSKHVVGINPEKTLVTMNGDEEMQGDVILIADGIRSKCRSILLKSVGASDPLPMVSSAAFRCIIPREMMLRDPATAELIIGGNRHVWTGPKKNVVTYPIAAGQLFNVVTEYEPLDLQTRTVGIWNREASLSDMREVYKDFESVVQKLLDTANSCMDWTLARLPDLPTWVSSNGTVVLIGDAAHATTPNLAQGAAMCLEDAVTIAECLSRVQSAEGISKATSEYQQLRKTRAERIQQGSWDNFVAWNLDDGPELDARNQMFRNQNKSFDEVAQGKAETSPAYTEHVMAEKTDSVALTSNKPEFVNPPEPEKGMTFHHPAFRQWVYGFDSFAEVKQYYASRLEHN